MEGLAVIPLVTGMLVERHRTDAIRARAMLERVARDHGVDEAVLAAALVAILAPPEPVEPEGSDGQPAAGAASGRGAEAAVPRETPIASSAPVGMATVAQEPDDEDGRAAAQLIADLTAAHPDRTVIYAADEDALRMLGSVGTAGKVVRAWRMLPLVLDVPLCASVTQRRPIFLESAVEMEREFPATRGGREGTEAWASIPVIESGRVIGVVGLSWREPVILDEATREGIIGAVESAGKVLVRRLTTGADELGVLSDLLDLIPGPWMVLSPTGGAGGGAFLVEAVAPSLPETWLGVALQDLFPGLDPSSDLLSDLQQVLHHGSPLVRRISTTRSGGAPWEQHGTETRMVRSGHRVVLTWR